MREQSLNRRPTKLNTSGFLGITWNKNSNKWTSTIKIKSKKVWLGGHVLIEDAVKARNEYIIKNNLEKDYKIQ